MEDGGGIRIEPRGRQLEARVIDALKRELESCPDVAFAHLPQVFVPEQHSEAEPVLFVWLLPEALRSLKSALNLVSEAVARALPEKQYLDVVVLNSAPELLEDIEGVGCLLVERDPEERHNALRAMASQDTPEEQPSRPWWWPF